MTEMGVPLTPEDIHKTVKLSYLFSANRPLTKTVREGGKIDGLNGWTVLEIPGHAASHIALYHEKAVKCSAAICFCPTAPPIRFWKLRKRGVRAAPMLDYLNSMKRLYDVNPSFYIRDTAIC